ncbi:MAG: PIN domain-containing protein [Rhodoglobus sp.]|nr:PIN domain-containing protein [Rhodoglobus sp.]
MNGSLDTNVILRLLLADVPAQHSSARALVESGRLHVSDAAVIETCFVLGRHYGLSRDEQCTVLGGFLAQPNIVCNLALLIDALELYSAHSNLSFEDCYLVSAAEHAGAVPLFTFDRKLARHTSAQLVG